jgi:hypothetical protein
MKITGTATMSGVVGDWLFDLAERSRVELSAKLGYDVQIESLTFKPVADSWHSISIQIIFK